MPLIFFHIFFRTSDFAAPSPYFPLTHPRHWQWMPHLRFPIWKYSGEGHRPTCRKESTLPYPPAQSLPLPVSFSSQSLALTKFINLFSVSHTEQQAGRGGNILYFIHCLLLGAWNTGPQERSSVITACPILLNSTFYLLSVQLYGKNCTKCSMHYLILIHILSSSWQGGSKSVSSTLSAVM